MVFAASIYYQSTPYKKNLQSKKTWTTARMSSDARPITPAAFAEALKALPLSSVYAKALEIHNSVAHLERSNAELKQFIDETPGGGGDKDCEDAIAENLEVIKNRGEKWDDVLDEGEPESVVNGRSDQQEDQGPPASGDTNGEPDQSGVYL
jgi:hypothetical protein